MLNLWGKGFDKTRSIATLVVSVALIIRTFFSLGPDDDFTFTNLKHNLDRYGLYLVFFMVVSFSVFLANGLLRLKESLDMWGTATKCKLNMMSLQQELTTRMMRTGKNRKGELLSDESQKVLDDACSDWHDACRIYGNRDFHTWFASWIITENSSNMLNSASLAMVMVVLGTDALRGKMDAGTFVVLVGAIKSVNSAFASVLNYYYSLPEGYTCLLYLAQVANMK